jgi:ketosteroid isomerase-like protein
MTALPLTWSDQEAIMMRFALTLILVCSLSILSYGQGKRGNSNPPERELLGLVKTWNDAELKGDAATIANLLADEFSFLGGSNREEYLRLMKPDDSLVIESNNVESPSVQVYGNAAVITSLNSFKLKIDGQPFEGKFLSMTVWIKKNDRWQCVKASIKLEKN